MLTSRRIVMYLRNLAVENNLSKLRWHEMGLFAVTLHGAHNLAKHRLSASYHHSHLVCPWHCIVVPIHSSCLTTFVHIFSFPPQIYPNYPNIPSFSAIFFTSMHYNTTPRHSECDSLWSDGGVFVRPRDIPLIFPQFIFNFTPCASSHLIYAKTIFKAVDCESCIISVVDFIMCFQASVLYSFVPNFRSSVVMMP